MRGIIGVTTALLLLLPQFAWGQGERARVGMRTVGSLEIVLYVWGPQQVIYPKGHTVPETGEPPTHHLDVTVYDHRRGMYVPYLHVKATVTDVTTKRDFSVALEPMIAEWLHYGANIRLPHSGSYSILVDVQPPDVARHKHLAEVWSTPAQAVFVFEYR
ncbi:MAG: iron transporter [Candidatus Methylomirabilales bacterium]